MKHLDWGEKTAEIDRLIKQIRVKHPPFVIILIKGYEERDGRVDVKADGLVDGDPIRLLALFGSLGEMICQALNMEPSALVEYLKEAVPEKDNTSADF